MKPFKKIVRFSINRNSGGANYDAHIDEALKKKIRGLSYEVIEVKNSELLPRLLAIIFFWFRAQYILIFGNINIAIISPEMMLIIPKKVSVISIAHHYDPSVFKGFKQLYVKIYHWFFIIQKKQVDIVISCSKYWSNFYKQKGFKNTITIYNGYDIQSMDRSIVSLNKDSVLKKYNLVSNEYLHLGKFAVGKGQKKVFKSLRDFGLPMIATTPAKVSTFNAANEVHLINADYDEYNILLKNAKAVICMSELKEGWCRVLHEAAIHSTPILGSGVAGMKELLDIGGFKSSTDDSLRNDLTSIIQKGSLSNDTVKLFRSFTLEKFNIAWQRCVNELLNTKD